MELDAEEWTYFSSCVHVYWSTEEIIMPGCPNQSLDFLKLIEALAEDDDSGTLRGSLEASRAALEGYLGAEAAAEVPDSWVLPSKAECAAFLVKFWRGTLPEATNSNRVGGFVGFPVDP